MVSSIIFKYTASLTKQNMLVHLGNKKAQRERMKLNPQGNNEHILCT